MVGFLFGGDTNETPESIKRKRDIVRALMGASAPKNIGEGINALGDGIVSAVLNERANKAEGEGRKSADSDFSALSGMFGGEAPASMPNSDAAAELSTSSPAMAGGPSNYRDAIASIESAGSGDYGAVGPTHPKLGRALGRYQIMEANIGPWSQEALGRAVTPDEFMADPKLQDAIFDKKFGGYVEKFGPEGAAQAWIGGPGGVGKLDRKDSLGTSIGAYGQKFNRAIGANSQVASIDPAAGMPAAPPPQASAYVDPTVSAPNSQPQAPAAMAPTQPAPQQQAALPPQQDTNALSALPPPVNVATPPVPPNAMPPQNQVAQALRQPPRSSNAELQAAQKVLSNQFSSEGQKAVAQALLRQEMSRRNAEEEMRLKQSDPAYQLGLEKDRLTIDQMRNPRISPAEQRRLDMEQQKQDFERNGISAAEKAKMDMDRQKFELDKEKAGNTNDISEYKFYEERAKAAGKVPMPPDQFWASQKKSGATNVTTNVGETDKFYENLDKKNAETFSALSTTGMQARGKLAQIDRLDALLSQSPQGAEGVIKQWLGDLGVKTEGLDAIQSTRALLEKMVPEQRAPGSGTMSDADIVMFRNSLPRVINQQGGNQVILQTMRGIAQYEQQMGDIADAVADRSISPAEGRAKIRDLKNPLADYNNLIREKGLDAATPKTNGRVTKNGVQWSTDE